jgi:hypothetical protein
MSPNKAALSATFHLTAGGRGRQEQAGRAGRYASKIKSSQQHSMHKHKNFW